MFLRARPRAFLPKCSYFYAHFHSSPYAWRKVVQKFKLADIGEGITECEIIKWTVQPSATVSSFDPLCEVQSDKATVEITSPFDGVLKEILVKEGEVAKVGAGLCLIEVEEEDAAAADPSVIEKPQQSPPETPTASEPENKRDTTTKHEPTRRPHPLDPNAPASASELTNDANVLATPSVRHFARSNGVDLAKLAPGSGRDGRIEKADIEAFLAGASSRSQPTAAPSGTQGGGVIVELGRTRYGMWKAMTKSLEIPHFGYSTSLDITSLHNLLPTLNTHIPQHFLPPPPLDAKPKLETVSPSSLYPPPSPPDVPEGGRYIRLTYLPILLKTLSKAMTEWPLFRSSITPSSSSGSGKPTLTIRPSTDIALALSTPTGLYTPTIQSVSSHSVYSLASHLSFLSHLGRQVPCGLTVKEMPKKGGTLTVSNVGAIGKGEDAFPRLVDGGGVAIVALGRAEWRDKVQGKDGIRDPHKTNARLMLPISWSADHRIVEGAEMAAFVECWRGYVENIERLVGEGV